MRNSVAQTTFRSDQLIDYLRSFSWQQGTPHWLSQLTQPRSRRLIRRCLSGFALAIAWQWNSKLILATGAGCGVMLLIYQAQQWNWQEYWQRYQRWFKGVNRWLLAAVGGGGSAAIITYWAATVWEQMENHWLAAGTIVQGMGLLSTLALLIGGRLLHHYQRRQEQFERDLRLLSHSDPLQRLIAVHQLSRWAQHPQSQPSDRQQLAQYFQFRLSCESDPSIRALLKAYLQPLASPQTKPAIPLKLPIRTQLQMKPAWEEE